MGCGLSKPVHKLSEPTLPRRSSPSRPIKCESPDTGRVKSKSESVEYRTQFRECLADPAGASGVLDPGWLADQPLRYSRELIGPDLQREAHNQAEATNEKAIGVLDLGNLSSELNSVVNWVKLGLNLGLPKHELDKIQQDYQSNDRQRLEMLDKWLRHTPNAVWEDVVKALDQMEENRMAENIRQKYKGK